MVRKLLALVTYLLIHLVVVPNDDKTPPIIAVSAPFGLGLQSQKLSGKCNRQGLEKHERDSVDGNK